MITTGRPISAREALDIGLVDEVVETSTDGDLLAGALSFARKLLADGKGKRRASEISNHADDISPSIFSNARDSVAKRSRGLESPLRAIDVVETTVTVPFDQGIASERLHRAQSA